MRDISIRSKLEMARSNRITERSKLARDDRRVVRELSENETSEIDNNEVFDELTQETVPANFTTLRTASVAVLIFRREIPRMLIFRTLEIAESKWTHDS